MSKWKLEGYDTLEGTSYPLPGKFDDEDQARVGAAKQMDQIEGFQPSETSGGQDLGGIQDQVFIVHPDGTKYRFHGTSTAVRGLSHH